MGQTHSSAERAWEHPFNVNTPYSASAESRPSLHLQRKLLVLMGPGKSIGAEHLPAGPKRVRPGLRCVHDWFRDASHVVINRLQFACASRADLGFS